MEARTEYAFNHTLEAAASNLPGLRLVTVSKVQSDEPQNDTELETYGWGVSSAATLQHKTKQGKDDLSPFGVPFSATCFYFGRALHLKDPSVPVGLIASSWGGSPIEPWMTSSAMGECGGGGNGGMYNAMIAPLLRLRLTGMLWDQGEANTKDPPGYSCLFRAAIRDWRVQFQLPEMAFLFVQIGPSSSNALTDQYGYRNDSYGVPLLDIRHAQLSALSLPRVAMASVRGKRLFLSRSS
jgi:sialate O-acetylesterase